MKQRCKWVDNSKIYQDYHDYEWGIETHDDRALFEMLCLEIFQAGLSFKTVLLKRKALQEAFDDFNLIVVSNYNNDKILDLLNNDKIIRHKLKILAIINNANQFLHIQKEFNSFDEYIYQFVNNTPIIMNEQTDKSYLQVLSKRVCNDLKKRGFKFIGLTIIESYLQAIGMINNHEKNCYLAISSNHN